MSPKPLMYPSSHSSIRPGLFPEIPLRSSAPGAPPIHSCVISLRPWYSCGQRCRKIVPGKVTWCCGGCPSPRRSARMTHLCSVRVTHTKNTNCPRAREEASDIIHAEGVRFAVPSSAPLARKVLTLRKDIRVPMKIANCPSSAGAGPHVSCPLAKQR